MKRILTGKLYPIILSPSPREIDELTAGDEAQAFKSLSFTTWAELDSYVTVGDGFDVSVEIDADRLVTKAIASMRQEQQTVRAEAEAKAIELERRIQSLLSIGMDLGPGPVVADDEGPF